jgi:hypothetical protein
VSPRSPFSPFCRLVGSWETRRTTPGTLAVAAGCTQRFTVESREQPPRAGTAGYIPERLRSGVVLATDPFLIRYLDEHPDDIYGLSPREFEELVASLLASSGYTVKLGPRGRDGGIDVFAERDGEFGAEL